MFEGVISENSKNSNNSFRSKGIKIKIKKPILLDAHGLLFRLHCFQDGEIFLGTLFCLLILKNV